MLWLGKKVHHLNIYTSFSSWFFEALKFNAFLHKSFYLEPRANSRSHKLERCKLGASKISLNRVIKQCDLWGGQKWEGCAPWYRQNTNAESIGWYGGVLEMECNVCDPNTTTDLASPENVTSFPWCIWITHLGSSCIIK